jgi:hypothetical protein
MEGASDIEASIDKYDVGFGPSILGRRFYGMHVIVILKKKKKKISCRPLTDTRD